METNIKICYTILNFKNSKVGENVENSFSDVGFDITKNIKTIEVLKSRLLSEVAFLHENMVQINSDKERRTDILSEIIILTYILSNKLGIDYKKLDEKVINKLKLAILEEDSSSYTDISSLLKYIDRDKL